MAPGAGKRPAASAEYFSQYTCSMQVYGSSKGGVMLKPEQDQLANEFYQSAYADGEIDAQTKILIGTAVAMTVGCYP